jgi:hypothetical protein
MEYLPKRFQEEAKLELKVRGKLGYRRLAYQFLAGTCAVGVTLLVPSIERFGDRSVRFFSEILAIDNYDVEYWHVAIPLMVILLFFGARAASRADARFLLIAFCGSLLGIIFLTGPLYPPGYIYPTRPSALRMSLTPLLLGALGQLWWDNGSPNSRVRSSLKRTIFRPKV